MFARHHWEGSPLCGQTFGPRYIARTAAIRKILRGAFFESALDVGCGSGNVTKHLADFAGRVHATDISETAVEVAQGNLSDIDNITFETIDLFAGTDSDRKHLYGGFDLVMLSEVLEHLDEDRAALMVISQLLRPGGYLLLTVPADPNQWSVEDELAGHRRRYTKPELTEKLATADFTIERVLNWGFPFTRALLGVERRLMGSRQAQQVSYSPVQMLLRPASLAFRVNGAVEPYLSALGLGIGYVVLARKPVAA